MPASYRMLLSRLRAPAVYFTPARSAARFSPRSLPLPAAEQHYAIAFVAIGRRFNKQFAFIMVLSVTPYRRPIMERELWLLLYHMALSCDKLTKARYRPAVIVGVYGWAVVHDRPVSWACQRRNWPEALFAEPCFCLPSQATMSRRLRSADIEQLLDEASWQLTEAWVFCWVKIIDAKPLPIGGFSKDGDARWGRGVKALAKGYKFYAIWGAGPMPLVWGLAAMNVSESAMARRMLALLEGGGYLLGDSLYDSNPLHVLASQHGHQLVVPRKKPGTGLGHRRHAPQRLAPWTCCARGSEKRCMSTAVISSATWVG